MTEYQDINAAMIDRWVEEGWEWGRPLSHESFERAKRGDWDVLLTPTKAVPHAWFGELKGKRILGLASGGGQQIPVFAALGAVCTVLDYSPRQLESERAVAAREGYDVEIVRADMAKPLPFPDGSFDLIFHPVSNCYVREVRPIWRECARVLRPGGRLLAGLDNGMNFIVGDGEREIVNRLPFDPLKNPDQMELLRRVDGGVQFSHTLDEQIGGQLEAGFTLLALYEDTNGSGRLHELGIPSFLATLSEKKGSDLVMKIGYSHDVIMSETDDITIDVPAPRPSASFVSPVALVTMLFKSSSDERPEAFIRRIYSSPLRAISASRIFGTRSFSSKKCIARRTGRLAGSQPLARNSAGSTSPSTPLSKRLATYTMSAGMRA